MGNDRETFGVKCEQIRSHACLPSKAAFKPDHSNQTTLFKYQTSPTAQIKLGHTTKLPGNNTFDKPGESATDTMRQIIYTAFWELFGTLQLASANIIIR